VTGKSAKKLSFIYKIFAAFLCAFFAATSLASVSPAAPAGNADIEKELTTQQKRLDRMEREIKKNNAKLKDAKKKEERAINDISRLSNQLAEAEQRFNVTELKRAQISNSLTVTMKKIQDIETSLEKVRKLLSKRVVAMYKYGTAAEFSLLFSASEVQDAISTLYLLASIAEQDKALISDLTIEKNALDKAKAELEIQKRELDFRNKELEKQKTVIQRTSNDRNKLLLQARKDKATFQAEQKELLESSNELKNKVNYLIAQKKQQSKDGKSATIVYYKGGKLEWPIRGKINSPYGTRTHPIFKTKATHTGVDLDGNKGDTVKADAAGEVLYTGWMRGYGQVVILDHGGDLTTVYAHLSGIDTVENKKIKTGDKIGHVGATGTATGNNLHFEVRVKGNTTDPMKYLQ
jgi:septal ring factor EnvC (AmiA/AmiB activator)